MKAIRFQGKYFRCTEFYSGGKPLIPDEYLTEKVPYNYIVANSLKTLGFSVVQELQMPEVGIIDIFASKGTDILIGECKSENDRDMKKALGQILTYSVQLLERNYQIKRAIIFTRTEPYKGRIRKDIEVLNKYLPFTIEVIRVSNNTPLLKI